MPAGFLVASPRSQAVTAVAKPARGLLVDMCWIDLILSGKKTWELRSTNTNVLEKIGYLASFSGCLCVAGMLQSILTTVVPELLYVF